MINSNRLAYADYLGRFRDFLPDFREIPEHHSGNRSISPAWINGYLPPADSAALYAFLCLQNPSRYFEIGSGNSTKFARRAIDNHKLQTQITSVDPSPRAEIDAICHRCIRAPLEDIDLRLFDELDEGDILFVDSSHRAFMNSDVAVFFLEALPRLNPGVLVEIHDIFLPYDYPPYAYEERKHWSEQYLLACYLLAEGTKCEIILPNQFIANDLELNSILSPHLVIDHDVQKQVGRAPGGASFWIRTL